MFDLAHLTVSLIFKVRIAKTADIDETSLYLKSNCSAHNEKPRIFTHNIPTEEPSFETITGYLKNFSKSIEEDENMSLKKSVYLADGF